MYCKQTWVFLSLEYKLSNTVITNRNISQLFFTVTCVLFLHM